jgi:hypothetical protein
VNGDTLLRDVDLWREAGYAAAVQKVVTARASDGRIVVNFPRVSSYQAVICAVAVASLDPAARPPVQQEFTRAPAVTSLNSTPNDLASNGQLYPVTLAKRSGTGLTWTISLGLGGSHDFTLRYTNPGDVADAEFRINASDGTVMDLRILRFRPTAGGAATELRLEGISMNAGDYTVTVAPQVAALIQIESLRAD